MSDGNRIADDALSSVIVHCQKDSVIDVNYKKKEWGVGPHPVLGLIILSCTLKKVIN